MVGFFCHQFIQRTICIVLLVCTVLSLKQQQISALEQSVVNIYRYIPMLFLAAMMSYLVTQF